MWIWAFPENRKQCDTEEQGGHMGSDTTQWGLSTVQPTAHQTMGHRSQCIRSPARLKHIRGQVSFDISQHNSASHPSPGCSSCFPMGLEGNIWVSPYLYPLGLAAFSCFCFQFTLKEATLYIPSQHSTFTTKLLVKWEFKGTFKNFINATWTYAFRLFIFKWDVTCNLVAILSIVFHF